MFDNPKQRSRKKKEVVLDPEEVREEAELRAKIQQSLRNQYVSRTVVNGTEFAMAEGGPGMMGSVGQDWGNPCTPSPMGATRRLVDLPQSQINRNEHGQWGTNDLAEIEFYKMRLRENLEMRLMIQQQQLPQIHNHQLQQSPIIPYNLHDEQHHIWKQYYASSGISPADLLNDPQFQETRFLEMSSNQNQMNEQNGFSSDHLLRANEREFPEIPRFDMGLPMQQQKMYEQQRLNISYPNQILSIACDTKQNYRGQNYVDLTQATQQHVQTLDNEMPTVNQDRIQGPPQAYNYEQTALQSLPQIYTSFDSYGQNKRSKSFSSHEIHQPSQQQEESHKPNQGNQYQAENMQPFANQPSNVSGITEESFHASSLQSWLKSSGGESIGFHSVGSMSASFTNESMICGDFEPLQMGVKGESKSPPVRKVAEDSPNQVIPCRQSSVDLPSIAEGVSEDDNHRDGGTNTMSERPINPNTVSMTVVRPKDALMDYRSSDSTLSGLSLSIRDMERLGALLASNRSEGIGMDMSGISRSDLMMSIDSTTLNALMKSGGMSTHASVSDLLASLLDETGKEASRPTEKGQALDDISEEASRRMSHLSLGSSLGLASSQSHSGSVSHMSRSSLSKGSSSSSGNASSHSHAGPSIMSEISEWNATNPFESLSDDREDNQPKRAQPMRFEMNDGELDELCESLDASM